MKVNLEQLKNILYIPGAFPLTIVANTEPKLLAGCPYKPIKLATVNGFVGFIYENAVNRQRIKEGKEPDFEAEPRRWGRRIPKTPLVEHNGIFYLEMKVEKTLYTYFENGKEIPKEEINPFLPEKTTRQELEKEVILRDYKLTNIKEIRLKGEIYHVY